MKINKIWLHHIKDIRVRNISSKFYFLYETDIVNPIWLKKKNEILEPKNEYQETSENPLNNEKIANQIDNKPFKKDKRMMNLSNLMWKDFRKMREKYGLGDSPLHSSDENEKISNEVFKELRPKIKKTMKEFLFKPRKRLWRTTLSIQSKNKMKYFLGSKSDSKVKKVAKNSIFTNNHLQLIHKLYQMKRIKSTIRPYSINKTPQRNVIQQIGKINISEVKSNY